MTDDAFVNVLVDEMESTQSVSFVEQLRKDARAKILAGKGEIGSLTSSALNGKSFGRNVELSAVRVLDCCNRALKIYLNDGADDDVVSATRPDFRYMTP